MSIGRHWIRDRRGVTSIEYGLISGLVALGLVASFSSVGANLSAVISAVVDGFDGGGKTAPPASGTNGIHR